MKREYWDSSEKLDPLDKEQIIKILKESGTEDGIAHEVVSQLSLINEDSNNIIFMFSDNNEYVVTGIHVPAAALDGKSGPVLMRGGNEKSIIAAFSREFIAERLENVDSVEEKTGLPGASDILWVGELENLAELVRIEMKANPPESWDDLLAGE